MLNLKTYHHMVFLLCLTGVLMLAACKKEESVESKVPVKSTEPEVAVGTDYPLDVCVKSGEKLGSMGKPHVINYEGVEVRFCCPPCEDTFRQDPATYLAKIKAAKDKATP